MRRSSPVIMNPNSCHCCHCLHGQRPRWGTCPPFVDEHRSLQFFPLLQPAFLNRYPPYVERQSPEAPNCEVPILLLGQPGIALCNGLTLPWFQPTAAQMELQVDAFMCTAPTEQALLRTKGFCGALGGATASGVHLYTDMVVDCSQEKAASKTGTVQNGRKYPPYCSFSMQSWRFQKAFSRDFQVYRT